MYNKTFCFNGFDNAVASILDNLICDKRLVKAPENFEKKNPPAKPQKYDNGGTTTCED